MLKSKNETITAKITPDFSNDSVRIQAGSAVIDNKWISFRGTVFKVSDYIESVVRGSRTRFFKDRGYAVFLLVGLDPVEGIKTIEGKHVKFTTLGAVPPPEDYSFLPLVGIILIQDGTRDLINGYKPLKQEYILFFSGFGNVLDKDLKGIPGKDSTTYGATGLTGFTGLASLQGPEGEIGITGFQGPVGDPEQGHTGAEGSTGINWNIHMPFQEFF